jgi:hypothetical protein
MRRQTWELRSGSSKARLADSQGIQLRSWARWAVEVPITERRRRTGTNWNGRGCLLPFTAFRSFFGPKEVSGKRCRAWFCGQSATSWRERSLSGFASICSIETATKTPLLQHCSLVGTSPLERCLNLLLRSFLKILTNDSNPSSFSNASFNRCRSRSLGSFADI